MVRYTLEEKVAICEIYHRTCSIVRTQRKFRQKFGKQPPSELMIRDQQSKFNEPERWRDENTNETARYWRQPKSIRFIEFFVVNPKCSLSRTAQQLQVSKTSLQRAVRIETSVISLQD